MESMEWHDTGDEEDSIIDNTEQFRFGKTYGETDSLPRDVQESHFSDWTSDQDSRRGSAPYAGRKESTFSTFSLVQLQDEDRARTNSVHTLGMKGLRKRSVPEDGDQMREVSSAKEEQLY